MTRILTIIALMFATPMLAACGLVNYEKDVPIGLNFSNGESGICKVFNDKKAETVAVPEKIIARRSVKPLKFDCKTKSGKEAFGQIEIVEGGILLVDWIGQPNRTYPETFSIPVR